MDLKKKASLRQKRIWRIRKKVSGTAERPRLCVTFTNKHIYAQAIDDVGGRVVFALSSLSKSLGDEKIAANIGGAEKLGKLFGEGASAAGIGAVVFDRHGRLYHGRVKAFAEAVRSTGIQF